MKRHAVEYHPERPVCPMTFWVHHAVGTDAWYEAEEFDPPRQAVVPGRGYPLFTVEYGGFAFRFASLTELRVCIDVLGRKLLPRTIELSRGRGMRPNRHWLSRLPAKVKGAWRSRERAVAYLGEALADFERQLRT